MKQVSEQMTFPSTYKIELRVVSGHWTLNIITLHALKLFNLDGEDR